MEKAIHDIGVAGSSITITSGLMLWFSDNATAIGAIVAVLMLLVTACFQFLNWRINQKRLDFDRRQVTRER